MTLRNPAQPTVAKCKARCARMSLATLAVLASVCTGNLAASPPAWVGDGDYRDLWQPSAPNSWYWSLQTPPNTDPPGKAFPRATAPLGLRLSFDAGTNQVLAEWQRPKHLGLFAMTNYQLRMRKANSRSWGRWLEKASSPSWGRWLEIGAIEATDQSIVIHGVEPGVTYEIEVRARNDRSAGPPASGTVTIPESLLPS